MSAAVDEGAVVRAPGKAMLFGEYAVLDGAWGVVAAVDRWATARFVPGAVAEGPFVAAAVAAARATVEQAGRSLAPGAPVVDSSALYADGAGAARRKLGLGSSAAVTVAAYGATLVAAGLPLPRSPRESHPPSGQCGIDASDGTFDACERAHAAAQGTAGSGLDVAAAIHGGVVRARRVRRPDGRLALEHAPVAWPAALALILVDTGAPASTADRVARHRALDRSSGENARLLDGMARAADHFAASLERGDADALLGAVAEWSDRLALLERAIDCPILTPALRRVADIAATVGGAAKPSGAGGGDLALCLCPPAATARLRERLLAAGLAPLDLFVGAAGLSTPPHLPSEGNA